MSETIIPSPVTPWRHLVVKHQRNTPPSAPPFVTTYLAVVEDVSANRSGTHTAVIANIQVDPKALRLAVIGPEYGDRTRSLTVDEEAHELAEDRVTAFLDDWRERWSGTVFETDTVIAGGYSGRPPLNESDLRELVAEVQAWRALAGARVDIITRLAEDLTAFIDPAPQEQTGGNA